MKNAVMQSCDIYFYEMSRRLGYDRIAPVAHARWLADRVPGAELVIRPGDGHISVLRGAEDALARLRELIGSTA